MVTSADYPADTFPTSPSTRSSTAWHVLGLHHVREAAANRLAWDRGFLALGAVLVIVGVALARGGAATAEVRVRRAA